jgi:hypothetical protein
MANKLLNPRGLFSSAMAVMGGWMLLVAQWAIAAAERTICYLWWTTISIGGLALALGTLTAILEFRRSER